MVAAGQTFVIGDADQPGGYAVVNDGAIVEFLLCGEQLSALPTAFKSVLDTTGASRALCKTFDASMLTAAASQPATTKTTGYLFRRIIDHSLNAMPEVNARVGTGDDIDRVLSMHDNFFTDRHEIERYVETSELYLFESADHALLGCGITTRVIEGLDAVDVGMVVAREHRRRGLGSHILSELKHGCLQRGDRPIAGCSADNVGSRRALERAGFATTHSVIEFRY